ncbi:MAG: glycosyltransferase [Bacteroidales bacterium]|jgi:GT2 family glycosyltransferase|nr:glycosyltransferase [Bacteroidales bacterium]
MKTVSIVIPSRNEEAHIERCLDSIVVSTYPKELISVEVCEGNSKDKTPSIIRSYQEKYPYIHYVYNEKINTPCGVNLGIKSSKSDIVIILWAHSFIAPDYIENSVRFLEDHPEIACVGGTVENWYSGQISKVIGFALSQPFGVGASYFRTGSKEGFVDTVSFAAYRREVFDKVGNFDTHLIRNSDDEFNFRLRQSGEEIYLSKSLKSFYAVRNTFQKFFDQYYQYGYWKVYVNKKHHQITTSRQLIPFFFVCFLFVGLIWSLFSATALIAYVSINILYLLLGFIVTFKKKVSLRVRMKMVAAFIILHVSYGSGYANGIGDFVISRKQPNRKMGESTR